MFSVVFIVRNEAESLPAALQSLGEVPDLVICDTGSTDTTAELAKRAGARVVHFEWVDDYSAARTFAEGSARFDWVVRFDADERFVAEKSFTEWLTPFVNTATAQGAGQIFVRRTHAGDDEHWFPRVHRRLHYAWKYPVHERVLPTGNRWPPSIAAAGGLVRHERRHRARNYTTIIEQEVRSGKADAYLVYHLAREYFLQDHYELAAQWLVKYLGGKPDYRFHESEAHLMLGRCLAAQGEWDAADSHLEKAAEIGPRAEPLWFGATLALQRNDYAKALSYLHRGRGMKPPSERQPFGEDSPPYVTCHNLYQDEAWRRLFERIPAYA